MNILYFLSDCMIPLVIVLVVAYGMFKKVDVFDEFIEGAKDGFLTVYKIMPTLIGLMIGVGHSTGISGYGLSGSHSGAGC